MIEWVVIGGLITVGLFLKKGASTKGTVGNTVSGKTSNSNALIKNQNSAPQLLAPPQNNITTEAAYHTADIVDYGAAQVTEGVSDLNSPDPLLALQSGAVLTRPARSVRQ